MIALSYLLFAWVFHTGTINPFRNLIGGGDGLIFGFPAKIFSTTCDALSFRKNASSGWKKSSTKGVRPSW